MKVWSKVLWTFPNIASGETTNLEARSLEIVENLWYFPGAIIGVKHYKQKAVRQNNFLARILWQPRQEWQVWGWSNLR